MSKIVLVTGASSGIGMAICRKLIQQGHTVYGGSRSMAHIGKVNGLVPVPLDVRSESNVNSVLGEIMQRSGRLDVLINAAGCELFGSAECTTDEEMRAVFDTNFFGVVHACRLALPLLQEANGGKIINIVDRELYLGMPYRSAYAASKSAVKAYSEALSLELSTGTACLVLLEIGPFATALHAHAIVSENESHFENQAAVQGLHQRLARLMDAAMSPEAIAHLVAGIVLHPKPKLYYRTHQVRYRVALLLKSFLPYRVFEKFVLWTNKLPTKRQKKSDD